MQVPYACVSGFYSQHLIFNLQNLLPLKNILLLIKMKDIRI